MTELLFIYIMVGFLWAIYKFQTETYKEEDALKMWGLYYGNTFFWPVVILKHFLKKDEDHGTA